MKWILLSLIVCAAACDRKYDARESETLGFRVAVEMSATLVDGALVVEYDYYSKLGEFLVGYPHEGEMRAYCDFRIYRGTYSLTPVEGGILIKAKTSDPSNLLSELVVMPDLTNEFVGKDRAKWAPVPSDNDWKMIAENPYFTWNEDKTKLTVQVPCRGYR